VTPPEVTLYERVGGGEKVEGLMGAFIDAIHESPSLNRQNPFIAPALARVDA
jgi:hypothetical protein